MKHLIILFFIAFNSLVYSQETTTYYLVRHAEKDRTNEADNNPHLTEKGLKRASNWNTVLSQISFNEIYSTNYFRTIETALPLASREKLEIKFYDPSSLNITDFKENTKGKTVFIVGHSNTIPTFVNQLIGIDKYQDIEDTNNSNLYIITLINGKATDQLLMIN